MPSGKRERLDDTAIAGALADLAGWEREGDQIMRAFEFRDFVDAMGFLARVAILAQAADHHPEIWNVYNRVRLTLSTHDSGGITQMDLDLARSIDVLL